MSSQGNIFHGATVQIQRKGSSWGERLYTVHSKWFLFHREVYTTALLKNKWHKSLGSGFFIGWNKNVRLYEYTIQRKATQNHLVPGNFWKVLLGRSWQQVKVMCALCTHIPAQKSWKEVLGKAKRSIHFWLRRSFFRWWCRTYIQMRRSKEEPKRAPFSFFKNKRLEISKMPILAKTKTLWH